MTARSRVSGAAVLAACLLAPTWAAAGGVEFTARQSANHIYYFGGFAISGDEGADGAPPPDPGDLQTPIPVTGFSQPTLAIAGSDHHDIQYLFWSGFLRETWDQVQTFQLAQQADDVVLAATGASAVVQTSEVCSALTGCDAASELHRSTNAQALEFRLDAVTDIRLTGQTAGGQWVDLLVWNAPAQRFAPVIPGAITTRDTSFDLARTLLPGLYQIRNNVDMFPGGGTVDVLNAWEYRLALLDTRLVSAVPEPGPLPLLAAGLAALAWLRRGRGQAARHRLAEPAVPGVGGPSWRSGDGLRGGTPCRNLPDKPPGRTGTQDHELG